jgi:hypothetical protein
MSLGALPLPLYFGARPNFDSETVGFALFFWFTTVPAPLIGGVMSFLLSRKPIPRSIYVGIVASTLVVGAVAPPTVRGHELDAQHRSEVEQIGALLKGIHQAEISYRAGRSDRAFTCDGSELPGMSDLGYGWRSMGSYRKIENNPLQNFAESVGARWVKTNNYLLLRNGTQILLACSDQVRPRGFRAYGIPSFLPAPKFSIGENGELTVSGDSQGQANSVPEK